MSQGTADPCYSLGHDVRPGASFCIRCGRSVAATGPTQRLTLGSTSVIGSVYLTPMPGTVFTGAATATINTPPAAAAVVILTLTNGAAMLIPVDNIAGAHEAQDNIGVHVVVTLRQPADRSYRVQGTIADLARAIREARQ